MEKTTKNVITREWVEKELRFYNGADLRSVAVTLPVMALVFIPLTALIVSGVSSEVERVWLKILISVLIGALTSCPAWGCLCSLYFGLREKRMLQNGEFEIVTREVLYKIEKPVRRHMEEFLGFDDFGEVLVGHTDYQLAAAGDLFYIVRYKGRKKVRLLYSAKMYEYNGIET